MPSGSHFLSHNEKEIVKFNKFFANFTPNMTAYKKINGHVEPRQKYLRQIFRFQPLL